MEIWRKHGPQSAIRREAAGLRWLAAAPTGVRIARVLDVAGDHLDLERVTSVRPTAEAADAFGRGLARTHAAGAPSWGAPPPDTAGDGTLGATTLPTPTEPPATWGEFYATHRVLPYLRDAVVGGSIDAAGAGIVEACAARIASGELDHAQPALVADLEVPIARLHGDLWSGNVLWAPRAEVRTSRRGAGPEVRASPGGSHAAGGSAAGGGSGAGVEAVLIDPAAHGGHAETDLAMLDLFGLPHLDVAIAAYDDASPLAPGWRHRVGLHQLHPLLVHAALFGGGYGRQAVEAARPYA